MHVAGYELPPSREIPETGSLEIRHPDEDVPSPQEHDDLTFVYMVHAQKKNRALFFLSEARRRVGQLEDEGEEEGA